MNELNLFSNIDSNFSSTNFDTQIDSVFSNITQNTSIDIGYFESVYSYHKPIWIKLFDNETDWKIYHELKKNKACKTIEQNKDYSFSKIPIANERIITLDDEKKQTVNKFYLNIKFKHYYFSSLIRKILST